MPQFLLISGSPRHGNTEYILQKIYAKLKNKNKKLILLRNQKIKHCIGCASCDTTNRCLLRDDMDNISKDILWANILIIGAPNYFDNVSGLLKDFIDRTNFLYENGLLKDKKIVSIVVGGGKIKNSKRVCEHALAYFAAAHKMNIVGAYYFQALKNNEVKDSAEANKKISKIIADLNSLR